MVIGIDGSRTFTPIKTGTENYAYQLLKALAKIDKKNQYIVYLRTQGSTLQGWPSNFSFKVINWPRLWTQVGLALQTFKDPIDLLFIPAHTLPLIHKKGLKTVVTVHDLGSEYLPKMHQLKQRLYLSFMQKYQLKGATKIIAVSNATKEDLVSKIGIDEKKIKVVYEGFDKKMLEAKGDTEDYSKQYFLFVGTIQPRKNLERIVLAFRHWLLDFGQKQMTNDQQLIIAGSKGWLSDEIYKLPKKLGIEDRIKFLGYVPDEELPGLYKGAKALVFASLFEGFGLPILEAQACGCPVITSNTSSMPEVAGKGAILVDPYSVEAIAHAMIRVSESNSPAEGEARQGRQRAKLIKAGFENIKRFSWEKAAKETLEVLLSSQT